VLICTHNDGIHELKVKMLPQLKNCDVFISHQITDGYKAEIFSEENIRYDVLHSKGLSKNRNNCLRHLQNDINLIADDDLDYIDAFEEKILSAFSENPDADIITFQMHGKERFKTGRKHSRWSIIKVQSVVIAFRKKSIENSNIFFDERFGLGAEYISGEENIFLKDSFDKGLKLLAGPAVIVRHPHISSGEVFSDELVKAKIAVFKRMYGNFISFLSIFYFALFKKTFSLKMVTPIKYVIVALSFYFKIFFKKL